MVYIVESENREGFDPRFTPAYEFVGEIGEVTRYKQNLASLALSAMKNNSVDGEQGHGFIRELQATNEVSGDDRILFHDLVRSSTDLQNDRARTLIKSAVLGQLTVNALWGELASLEEFFEPSGSDNLMWLTENGLDAFLEGDELKVNLNTDIADVHGKDSLEFKTAAELGLNAEAFQYELVREGSWQPKVLSDYIHNSLGRLDEDGKYEPVVTVLESNHPLRQHSE